MSMRDCLHLLVSSVSFVKNLKFSLFKSFISLIRFVLRYWNVFEAIVITPAFHRICCDQGLCFPDLVWVWLLSGPSTIQKNLAPSLVDWLPSQKTHVLCLTYQGSHRLPLASPAALLSLLYRSPHPQPWRYPSFYEFWYSCVSEGSTIRNLI